jgi:DNA-binding response OmpR family regulator
MDLEMPVVDRWDPVRRLRNDPHTHDIPIIGMSAHALESEREQAIATGCDEFDAKPIEFDSLVATIRRVLALDPMCSDFAERCKIKGTMRLRIASRRTVGGSVLLAAELSKPVADKHPQ